MKTQDGEFGFDANWLQDLTSTKADDLAMLRMIGGSMEPTLCEGDNILLDLADGPSRLRDGI